MLTVNLTIDGINHKCDTLADFADDLKKPLAMLGVRLKAKAAARYKAQAFAPLAAGTIEHRFSKGLASLEAKLVSDVRRAFGRARSARAPRGLLERMVTSKEMQRATDDALSASAKGVQNRQAVLAEFQRRHRQLGLEKSAQGKALTLKQSESLSSRTKRAVAKAVTKPILGGLDRTLMIVVEDGSVTLRSATHQTWSEAHNVGATAGHGAKIPPRPTIFLEADDLVYFREALKEHLLLPFDDTDGG